MVLPDGFLAMPCGRRFYRVLCVCVCVCVKEFLYHIVPKLILATVCLYIMLLKRSCWALELIHSDSVFVYANIRAHGPTRTQHTHTNAVVTWPASINFDMFWNLKNESHRQHSVWACLDWEIHSTFATRPWMLRWLMWFGCFSACSQSSYSRRCLDTKTTLSVVV